MNEKFEPIFAKYEEMTLKNFERYENGEELNTEVIHALNDSIRILHHIAKLRNRSADSGVSDYIDCVC